MKSTRYPSAEGENSNKDTLGRGSDLIGSGKVQPTGQQRSLESKQGKAINGMGLQRECGCWCGQEALRMYEQWGLAEEAAALCPPIPGVKVEL